MCERVPSNKVAAWPSSYYHLVTMAAFLVGCSRNCNSLVLACFYVVYFDPGASMCLSTLLRGLDWIKFNRHM